MKIKYLLFHLRRSKLCLIVNTQPPLGNDGSCICKKATKKKTEKRRSQLNTNG